MESSHYLVVKGKEIDWDRLKAEFSNPLSGVKVKDIKKKFGLQGSRRNCFLGRDAIAWLMKYFDGIDRKKAVDIGVRLWASGLFRHISQPHRPFGDDKHYYRFKYRKEVEKEEKAKRASEGSFGKKQKKKHRRRSLTRRRSSEIDSIFGSDQSLADSLKRKEGWLEVKLKNNVWTKKWCSLQKYMEDCAFVVDDLNNQIENEEDEGNDGKTTKWILAVYEQVVNPTYLELIHAMCKPEGGIKIKSRRLLHKKYHDCFVGKKAVDWLVINRKECEGSREKAALLMDELMQKGLVCSVANEKFVFQDNSDWYKFLLPNTTSLNDEGEGTTTTKTTGGGGGGGGVTPIMFICLIDGILFKLQRDGDYVELVLSHSEEAVSIVHSPCSPSNAHLDASPSRPGSGGRRSGLLRKYVDDVTSFSIRFPQKDETTVKDWIFALQAAVLAVNEEAEDNSPLIREDEYTQYYSDEDDDEIMSSGGEEEEEDQGYDVSGSGEVDLQEEKEISSEMMNSAERAVLDEMKECLQKEKLSVAKESAERGEEIIWRTWLEPPSDDREGKDQHKHMIDFTTVPDSELLKYLRARKLEVGPAIALMKNGVTFRVENHLNDIHIVDVVEDLRGGMLQIVPNARDRDGRIVLVILPQYYRPAKTPPMQLLKAIIYLLDCAMNGNDQIQRVGFSVLVDCKGSRYANFDAHMPKVIINGIVSRYPARVGYVIITNTPWFFRFIWAVIRPLLSEILVAKFHIINMDGLIDFVLEKYLLPMHGGSNAFEMEDWIKERFEIEGFPYTPPSGGDS